MWAGLLGAGLFLGAGLVVSVTVKRLFFAAWSGSLAVTTVAMVWLCWALALGQLLGAVGLLRRGALLGAALLSAVAAITVARAADLPDRRRTADPSTAPAATEAAKAEGWGDLALTGGTVLLVAFVAAIWTARTVIALHRGINDPDSLGYHLPFMVTFAQSGYADQHRLLIPLVPIQFFPANDELLSAIALAITHTLAFAAAKNLIFGGLAVVSAHAMGKAFGAARLTMAATAIVLGFPVVAFSQPGEAVNDALLLAVLVGALAVLAHARDRPAPYVLVLGCAGLMLGIKFSAIVPAAGLGAMAATLLLVRVPRHRWRWAGAGIVASAAMGGSWYIRNAVNYGNPVPPVDVGLGPVHLHTVHGVAAAWAFSVAHYAVHGRFLGLFARGLVRGLGPLVIVTAGLCLLGGVDGLRSSHGYRRGLSCLGAVAVLGYLVTPASAYGKGAPVLGAFVINLHYAAPALLVGVLAGALVLAPWRWAWTLPLVGVVAVATSIGPGRRIAVWSPEMGGPGFVLLMVAALAATAVALAWSRPPLRRLAGAAALGVAVTSVVALAVIAGRYRSRQMTDPVVHWAASVRRARLAAWVTDPGDLFGPHANNRVTVMNRVVDGAAVPLGSCEGWKRAVLDGHFGYTAVNSGTAQARWLRADPAFRIVADETVGESLDDLVNLRRYGALVFQVVGRPDVGCPGQ